MYCQAEVPLILEKKSFSGSRYQIDAEGVRFLRSLDTKRLRIVFNVSTTLDITPFTVLFCEGALNQHQPVRNDDLLSCLTIMKNIEVMDADQVLITLNARHKATNTNYLILGYLISSVILFHTNGQLGQQSDLLVLLSSFQEQLKHTNIKDLQAEMRFASGFDKKPYFVCVCHNVDKDNSQAKERFLNFFKDVNPNSTTHSKKSLDVLLDYLPNRTSFYISNHDSTLYAKNILKIKRSLQAKATDRKIFNFEVTGAAVQSLVLELCQIFNQSHQEIDLVALYIQVINYMKKRVFTQSVDFYLRRVSCMISNENMPYNLEQMLELHQKVVEEVHAHTCVMALHCMNLIEYISVWEDIHTKIQEVFLDLEISNGKASQEFNMVLKEELMGLQLQELDLLPEEVAQKIDAFSYNSRGNNSKDQMGELCKNLLDVYCQKVTRKVRQLQSSRLDLEIGNYQLTGKVVRLEGQNTQLIMRHQLGLNQRQTLNHKSHQHSCLEGVDSNSDCLITEYETTIRDLGDNLLRKQVQIEDLRSRLQECEAKMLKDKSKPHGQTAFTIKQLRASLKDFDKTFGKVQKMDDIVKSARKEVEKKKQEFLQERDKWVLKIQKLKGEKSTLVKNQQELKRVITHLEQTVNLFQQIVQYNKDNLQKNVGDVALGRLSRAEMETKLGIYRKCIELICQGHKKGKNDSLLKFLKLVQCQDVKDFVLQNIQR